MRAFFIKADLFCLNTAPLDQSPPAYLLVFFVANFSTQSPYDDLVLINQNVDL